MSERQYNNLVKNMVCCGQPEKVLSDVEIAMMMASLGG
jgi:DNA-directed RNA polymerase specialized sigma54-like protein